jgi:plasmid stabilization system protein ParE
MAIPQKRRVEWSDPAFRNFYDVLDRIALHDDLNADRFGQRIEELADSLETFAERGRVVPEFGRPDIRELLPKNYRLIYKISDDAVIILAFIHGKRLLSNALEADFLDIAGG